MLVSIDLFPVAALLLLAILVSKSVPFSSTLLSSCHLNLLLNTLLMSPHPRPPKKHVKDLAKKHNPKPHRAEIESSLDTAHRLSVVLRQVSWSGASVPDPAFQLFTMWTKIPRKDGALLREH